MQQPRRLARGLRCGRVNVSFVAILPPTPKSRRWRTPTYPSTLHARFPREEACHLRQALLLQLVSRKQTVVFKCRPTCNFFSVILPFFSQTRTVNSWRGPIDVGAKWQCESKGTRPYSLTLKWLNWMKWVKWILSSRSREGLCLRLRALPEYKSTEIIGTSDG